MRIAIQIVNNGFHGNYRMHAEICRYRQDENDRKLLEQDAEIHHKLMITLMGCSEFRLQL